MSLNLPKKLIEIALPLEQINAAAGHEKHIRQSHPSTLHLWWARRPLAAARAVIFASLVDDPSAVPEEFPTEPAQRKARERLFHLTQQLVQWENISNESLLQQAREEIQRSWARWCRKSGENPRKLPPFHDPFAGGGSLPLEAQRLGLEAHASDLNPVAVVINKAMIEIPPRFASRPPVNPEARRTFGSQSGWQGAAGLAEDIHYYGQWVRSEAEKRVGHLYPKATTPDGQKVTVIAWLWARTVASPNPAFANIQVPLISSFWLSAKPGKLTWLEPVVQGREYTFAVRKGNPPKEEQERIGVGTKLGRGAHFRCILSDSPISPDYIKAEGTAGRMGTRLMAMVVDGERARSFLPPDESVAELALKIEAAWRPEGEIPARLTGGTCYGYGMHEWGDLFTSRQLVLLTTLSDLAAEAKDRVRRDAINAGMQDDGSRLSESGTGVTAYAEAIST